MRRVARRSFVENFSINLIRIKHFVRTALAISEIFATTTTLRRRPEYIHSDGL